METVPDTNRRGETMPALLTTMAIQPLLSVDRSTIYRMADDGRLPAIKVCCQWRFHAEAIKQWVTDRSGGSANGGRLRRSPLPSLVDLVTTQAIAQLVADLLGVMVVVTDMEGRALGDASNPCRLQLAVGNQPGGERHQIEERRRLCATSGLASYLTASYLGLLCARSFIRIGTELAGMVIAGGVAPDEWPPPPEKLDRLAKLLDLPVADVAPYLDEVYHLDQSSQQRVVSTLPKVADLISNLASAKDAPAGATQQPNQRTTT